MAEEKKVDAPVETLEEMKKRFKPKKKIGISEEMMTGAKSYDDKVVLVKMLTEKEQSRVVSMIKNMLKAK
jgi:histidyl-tRNA synthetase